MVSWLNTSNKYQNRYVQQITNRDKDSANSMDPVDALIRENNYREEDRGYIALWTETLKQAGRDCISIDKELREEAMKFINSDRCEWICEVIGIDYETFLVGLVERVIKAGGEW